MSSLPRLSASTLGDQAVAAIRKAIVDGALARGEKVTERGLATSLNISPTPVREAIRRLEQDGLVERTGPRSVRVVEFGEEQLGEVTLIEDALRAVAARLAAEKASEKELDRMRKALSLTEALTVDRDAADVDRGTVFKIVDALREFHRAIDEAAGNPTLARMLKMVEAFDSQPRRRRLLLELELDPATVRERFEQHRAIFEAIAGRKPERAERLMRAHSSAGSTSALSGPLRRRRVE